MTDQILAKIKITHQELLEHLCDEFGGVEPFAVFFFHTPKCTIEHPFEISFFHFQLSTLVDPEQRRVLKNGMRNTMREILYKEKGSYPLCITWGLELTLLLFKGDAIELLEKLLVEEKGGQDKKDVIGSIVETHTTFDRRIFEKNIIGTKVNDKGKLIDIIELKEVDMEKESMGKNVIDITQTLRDILKTL
jgi:hypothetical protein